MRDLSKTRLEATWYTKNHRTLAQIRVGSRGAEYICYMIAWPGSPNASRYPKDIRDLSQRQLSDAAREVGEYLTAGEVRAEVAEKVLDLIYAELNRRLNRVLPV